MSDSRELLSLVGLSWLTEEGEARGDLGMMGGMLGGRDGRIFKIRRKKDLGHEEGGSAALETPAVVSRYYG